MRQQEAQGRLGRHKGVRDIRGSEDNRNPGDVEISETAGLGHFHSGKAAPKTKRTQTSTFIFWHGKN